MTGPSGYEPPEWDCEFCGWKHNERSDCDRCGGNVATMTEPVWLVEVTRRNRGDVELVWGYFRRQEDAEAEAQHWKDQGCMARCESVEAADVPPRATWEEVSDR